MRRIFLAYLFVAVGIAVTALVVWRANAGALVFEPADFISRSLDFLANLVVAFLSFLLLNVFWDQHQRQERAAATRQRLTLGLQQFNQLVSEALQLLEQEFSERDDAAIQQHEKRVLRQLNQLHSLKQGFVLHLPAPEAHDDQPLAGALDRFWAEVAPAIDDLAGRGTLYPDIEEIRDRLQELQRGLAAISAALTTHGRMAQAAA